LLKQYLNHMAGSYVFPVIILPLFLSIFIITRFSTVLFHEVGHAIPALVFTKEKVIIYLGSYFIGQKACYLSVQTFLSLSKTIEYTLADVIW
jgi:hypothetical protein